MLSKVVLPPPPRPGQHDPAIKPPRRRTILSKNNENHNRVGKKRHTVVQVPFLLVASSLWDCGSRFGHLSRQFPQALANGETPEIGDPGPRRLVVSLQLATSSRPCQNSASFPPFALLSHPPFSLSQHLGGRREFCLVGPFVFSPQQACGPYQIVSFSRINLPSRHRLIPPAPLYRGAHPAVDPPAPVSLRRVRIASPALHHSYIYFFCLV